jgi:hypothetical protein
MTTFTHSKLPARAPTVRQGSFLNTGPGDGVHTRSR